jgi:transposase-like protein
MFKPIAQEIKDQIISRIKNNGEAVSKLALEYTVSAKTIYGWLRKQSDKSVSTLEYARLKRENRLLLEIVGKLTLEKNQVTSIKKN